MNEILIAKGSAFPFRKERKIEEERTAVEDLLAEKCEKVVVHGKGCTPAVSTVFFRTL